MKVLKLVLVLGLASLSVQAAELRFTDQGKLIAPDQTYLEQAYKDESDGYYNDSMRNFIKAAEFGNPYAQAAIGYRALKDKDYPLALAWFRLIDLNMIEKSDGIEEWIDKLEAVLTPEELTQSDEQLVKLRDAYGKVAALENREKWRKNLTIGGSRVKGYIPSNAKIYSAGRVEKVGVGEFEIWVDPFYVTGDIARGEVHEFTYEYDYRFTQGRVKLNEVEIVEEEQ